MKTNAARKIHFHGEDADIFGTGEFEVKGRGDGDGHGRKSGMSDLPNGCILYIRIRIDAREKYGTIYDIQGRQDGHYLISHSTAFLFHSTYRLCGPSCSSLMSRCRSGFRILMSR